MSRGIPIGALRRAMDGLTIGITRAQESRRERDRQMGIGEIDLQYQIEISGYAGVLPGFTVIDIDFDHDFFYAPGQRDATHEMPHFTFGAVVTPGVMVTAHVNEWKTDERTGAIVGASVGIGAIGVGRYSGHAHLNFQGYGDLREQDISA